MAETTNYQCPNCGGQLAFIGATGTLHCEFCESDFTPAQVEAIYAERQAKADARAAKEKAAEQGQAAAEQAAQAQAAPGPQQSAAEASMSDATRVHVHRSEATDPVQAYLENSRWDAESENMRAYNCSSCGAQLIVDQVTAVTQCPYCGNNAVLPGQLSDVLKPDWIIPFKLGKEDAVKALNNYYAGKKYLPNTFTEANHIEEIQGVYVPFWLYTGETDGHAHYRGERITTWSDADYDYTKTDFYEVERAGSMTFTRVPVDGSTRMPNEHMDAIEPFDYGELTDFSVAYLPGYVTDRYDMDVKECDGRARSRVEETCESMLRQTVKGYATLRTDSSDVDVTWNNIGYALLPVWMLHTKWDDKDYLFAMNGQTGKLIGDLPIDNGKVTRHFLMIFGVLAIVIFLIVQFALGGYFA